ncbi:MAG: polyprenyl synthetase family protein [Mycobacterium sp.]
MIAPALHSAPVVTRLDVGQFEAWRGDVRESVLGVIGEFVTDRCTVDLRGAGVDVAADVLVGFVGSGKCLRSTFMLLGWLCGEESSQAALRASASLELLHTFALLQDDVMDGSPLRRGRASAHVQFADWHRDRGLSGSAERFGESAAILLGDLCLVWAEQMLRGSGLGDDALNRAWPRYDAMRTELAVGQFADLVNDVGGLPTLDEVLEVARRKSGNYTVRRPLEIGAAMAGCGDLMLTRLGAYGDAVGEAFQLRDDVLGIFGSPAVTGKPVGADLTEHKATSVVVAAHHMAEPGLRRQLAELMNAADLDDADVVRWRTLIAETGAVRWIEEMIAERLRRAAEWVDDGRLDDGVRAALLNMASVCTERAA